MLFYNDLYTWSKLGHVTILNFSLHTENEKVALYLFQLRFKSTFKSTALIEQQNMHSQFAMVYLMLLES